MKTRPCLLLALATLCAVSCAPPQTGSGHYYPAGNGQISEGSAARRTTATTTASTGRMVPRGGYAPGSGPTAMPQGEQFMHQYRESGPFGSYSNSTVIQATGGVQSYQTIGNMPVYPGGAVPGYVPDQPYYGGPASQQPVFVPGTGGNPGYYINPATGARVGR
ncbi:MAG TPA: hypothetical protein VGE39_26605 [Prosthecobacter sp.]